MAIVGTIAGTVALAIALLFVLWLKARVVSSGQLSREWGMQGDAEAKAEIERISPGATKPLEAPGPRC